MRNGLLIGMMFWLAPAFGAEHMSVAVCNIGDLPAQVIERAEAEAGYVFQSMDVEVRWTGCGARGLPCCWFRTRRNCCCSLPTKYGGWTGASWRAGAIRR